MTQRNNRTKNRTTSKKPTRKNAPSRSNKKNTTKNGGNFKWLLLALFVIAIGITISMYITNLYDEAIIEGIKINDVDISGMTKEQALEIIQEEAQKELDQISVTFRYNDKSWNFDAEDLQAVVNVDDIIEQAYSKGHQGNFIERFNERQDIKTLGAELKSSISINKTALVDALIDVRQEIDNPMIETKIEFDPTGYDFFADKLDPEIDMSKDMFTITKGTVGYEMDYDDALNKLNAALTEGWNADIEITAKLTHPKYTVEELEECTTLIFHSSSAISSKNKLNTNRNSNIQKAINFYKGLIVMPGEWVSYNELLGERTIKTGWLEAPTITQDKTLVDALGGGICQASTTIFNATFMAGAEILERGPHSWPAYYGDFGYGMDAMVNWGTDDFVFANNSEYPIFFNTYFWYDKNGNPGYIDVDVYTMPQKDENGNILHIMPESKIEENLPPEEPIYRQDLENEFVDQEWIPNLDTGMLEYTYRQARNTVKVRVYRVWYKDSQEVDKGVWKGGIEVKREESHYDIYTGVQAIIYTKPIPSPTPEVEPTPTTDTTD